MRAQLRLRHLRSHENGPIWQRLQAWSLRAVAQHPVRLAIFAALAAAAVSMVSAGPVAAVIASAYAVAGVWAWRRHLWARAVARERRRAGHQVRLLAADLRAGAVRTRTELTPEPVGSHEWSARIAASDPVCCQIRFRLEIIAELAERVGMPTAELLDRLVADLRARSKLDAIVVGQTAGTVASSRMLAALPIAGLALGEAMGVGATEFLLYTPIGAGCAFAAMALQGLGLLWAQRLSQVDSLRSVGVSR